MKIFVPSTYRMRSRAITFHCPRIAVLAAFLFSLLSANELDAQEGIRAVVSLDEFVVSSANEGFDVDEFIEKVKNDTTFYQAFLNMRFYPHDIRGALTVYYKGEEAAERGSMQREAVQHLDSIQYMWVEILSEDVQGRIRKRNGEWRYFTAEMYDEVFFPEKPRRVLPLIVKREQELQSGSRIEKHKSQIKRLMFNPGTEIENVPFIGDRLAIFEDHMIPYYDYALFQARRGDKDCLAFSCITKVGEEDNTVIRDLTSYFDPDTYHVLAREYRLAYSNLLLTFDIRMEVDNALQQGILLPQKVKYDGFWNVPLRKAEIIRFEMTCDGYDTGVMPLRE